jgi:hypothetical protein
MNPVILETKLQANVTQDMFADGIAVTKAALGDKQMPITMTPKSLAASSSTTLYGALAPELSSRNGAFLSDAQVWEEPLEAHATGEENAEKLWELSEKLVGEKFEY